MADTELTIVVRARDELTKALKQMGETVDAVARSIERSFGTDAVGQLQLDFGEAAASAEVLEREIGDVGRAAGATGAQARDAMGRMSADAQRAGVATDRLERDVVEVGTAAARTGSQAQDAMGRFVAGGRAAEREVGLLTRALRTAQSGVRGFTGAFAGLGRAIKSAIAPALPFLTIAGAGLAIFGSVADAKEFSRAMSEVGTIVDTTTTDVAALRSEVLNLSRQFGRSEVDQARGLYQAISSGAESAEEGLRILNASTRLAIAGLAETEETVDLLTSTLNAYRAQNLDAERAADVLFQTVNLGKARVDELATSYGRVLPLGASLGVSFEELSGFLATLTLTFGSVEESVTALRGVLSGLLQISGEQRAELAALGAAVDPVSIANNGLAKTLLDLGNALGNDTDRIRQFIPDVRGLTGALAILNDGGVNLNRVLAQIEGATGSVGRAFNIQMADPARRLDLIINGLRISFSQAFGGAFLNAIEAVIERMGGLDEAGRRVADLGEVIGSALGGGLRIAIDLFGEAVSAASQFIDALGGAQNVSATVGRAFESVGRVVAGSIGIIRTEVGSLIDAIQSIPASVQQVQAEIKSALTFRLFDAATAQESLAGLNAALAQLEKGLGRSAAAVEILRQTSGISFEVEALLDRGSIEEARALIEREIAGVKLEIQGDESGFDNLNKLLQDARAASKGQIDQYEQEIRRGLADLSAIVKGDVEKLLEPEGPTNPTRVEIEADLSKAEAEVAGFEQRIADLRALIGRGVEFGTVDAEGLRDFAAEAAELQEGLDGARRESDELRASLEGLIRTDIRAIERQIADIEAAARDAERTFSKGSQVAEATGAAFAAEVERLRAVIAGLEQEIESIRPRVEIEVVPVPQAPLFEGIVAEARQALAGLRGVFDAAVETASDPAFVAALGRARGQELVKALSDAVANAPDPLAGLRDSFAGGEDEAAQIERRIQAQRDQVEAARELVSALGPIGPITAQYLDSLDRATDQLEAQADLAERQRQFQAEFGRQLLEREAVRFGVEIVADDQALFEGVRRAQLAAQDAADELEARGLRAEAITLGITLDQNSVEQLRADIQAVRAAAQEFAAENPLRAAGLEAGVNGLSNALADAATGTKSLGDAMRDFASSAVQQLARVAFQLAIVKSLTAAFGGPDTGAGAFVASLVGAKGLVLPYKRGGTPGGEVYDGLAAQEAQQRLRAFVEPYRRGGVPVSHDLAGNGQGKKTYLAGLAGVTPRAATAYALGGTPNLDRVVGRPTLERTEALAGTAIVPLSGGGVETPDGRHLPLKRRGRELTVAAYAKGGAPFALYGEAGPEAVMRLQRAADGRPGLREAGGGVLPLTRVAGGRLGVEVYGAGGVPDITRTLRTAVAPFEAGGVPDITRTLRTTPIAARPVARYALGGVPQPGGGGDININLSVPVNVQSAPASAERRGDEDTAARIGAALSRSARLREIVAGIVAEEVRRRPSLRAGVRGDRV